MGEIRPGVKPVRRSTRAYTPQKPYLKLWQSPSTFFRSAVRHLKDTVTKESAFEKPYLDLEYPTMHLNLPYPDWPSEHTFQPGRIPPVRGRIEPDKGDLVTGSGCKYCIITCYGDRAAKEEDCPKIYAWCHISIACTSDPQLSEANPGDTYWEVNGPKLSVINDSMDGINIYADWDQLEANDGVKIANFTVTLHDGLDHVCRESVQLECPSGCNCDTEPDVAWDDANSAETVGQSDLVGIAVTGGCPPYSWSIDSYLNRIILINSTTDDVDNSIYAYYNACGLATITVTDACGDSCTGYVRCVNGVWTDSTVWYANFTDIDCADGTAILDDGNEYGIHCYQPDFYELDGSYKTDNDYSLDAPSYYKEYITGGERWAYVTPYGTEQAVPGSSCTSMYWSAGTGSPPDTDPHTLACNIGLCSYGTPVNYCYVNQAHHQTWECP